MPYHTFDDPEIYLASTAWPYGDGDRYYLPVGFKIINRTKAPITVKFSDVSVRATGLIQVKRPKKVNDYHMVLHMDGYDFEFAQGISSK